MKRIATAATLVLFAATLSFGDDANVLPGGVARLRVIPAMTSFDKSFDDGGKAQDASPTASITTLSGAFEFGLTDQITGGLKWAPGYYAASKFDDIPSDLSSNEKLIKSGLDDLEIGAKIMILGPKGFVSNELLRVALTPGVSLPLDKYDAKKEFDNFADGKEYRPQAASSHRTFGYGIKADLDYLISEALYVNLHAQALQYQPLTETTFETRATHAGTYQYVFANGYAPSGIPAGNAAGAQAVADAQAPLKDSVITKGLEYTLEAEPHYTISLGENTNLGIGVPLTYTATLKGSEKYNNKTEDIDPTYSFTVKPYASFFTLVGPLPLELQLEYDKTISGKNSPETGTFLAQLKLFYKFY